MCSQSEAAERAGKESMSMFESSLRTFKVEGAGLAIYVAALQDIWRREEARAGSEAALQQMVSFHFIKTGTAFIWTRND